MCEGSVEHGVHERLGRARVVGEAVVGVELAVSTFVGACYIDCEGSMLIRS